MERKNRRALFTLYCLLSLCASTSAKPVNHARHLALATSSMTKPFSTTVGPEMFVPQEARRRQDRAYHLTKRASTWTVQAGDTGNGIAERLSINFIQLAFMNPTVQWKDLQIGQVLNIPCDDASTGGRLYSVVAGDTGNAIAAANGIRFAQLDTFNPNVDWYNLQPGQTLLIPAPGVDATRIAQLPNMANVEQDAMVTATERSISTTTMSQSTTTSSMISVSIPASMLAIMNEPSSTSTSLLSENTFATRPVPANKNDISAFLTPGGPGMAARSVEDQNNTTPKLVKLRLIRNEQFLDTDSARQAVPQPQQPQMPSPHRSASPSSSTQSNPSAAAASPSSKTVTTYTVKAGETGNAIATAHSLNFDELSRANPNVTWTSLQVGQALNLPRPAKPPTTPQTSNKLPDRETGQDIYTLYAGSVASAYPVMESWVDFERLWATNLAAGNIGATCKFSSGDVPANTGRETHALGAAIRSVAAETGVHPSFILVMVLQESAGCVRVPTTSSWQGIRNPGLMQSFRGMASCNVNGRMMLPCPANTIKAMIKEGVTGVDNVGIVPALKTAATRAGMSWPLTRMARSSRRPEAFRKRDGQAEQMYQVGDTAGLTRKWKMDEAMLYYQAARIYNSGSIPMNGDLSGSTGSTWCYVSDVVNRLMGWASAPKECLFR